MGFRGTKTLPDQQLILAMEMCDTSLGDVIEARMDAFMGPLEAKKIKKVREIDILNRTFSSKNLAFF